MTPTSSVRRQRGSVTLMFLFSMTSILLSLLAAIDIMRYNLVQSRLQSALDAAVLAAGRNLGNLGDSPSQSSQQAWRQDAIGYLSANMPNGYLGSNYDIGKVEITVSGDARAGQQIGMRATAELPLLVAGFLTTKTLPLAAGNTAMRRSRSDLELVMVLDNTGSMDWGDNNDWPSKPSRLDALKSAANTLVDTLFSENIPNSSFSIGLVPFATTVNPRDMNGNKMTRLLKNGSTSPLTSSSWDGCLVDPREAGGYLPTPPKAQNPASRPFAAYARMTRNPYNSSLYTLSTNGCIQTPTTFLTSNKTTIKKGISAMTPDGGTVIPAGTMWGWRMLSPDWRGANGWGSPTLPQDRSSFLTKAMIIMTDGENGGMHTRANARYTQFGMPDPSKLTSTWNGYTGTYSQLTAFEADEGSASLPPYGLLYKYANDNANSAQQNANDATSLATLNRLLLATCSAAKADGIKIWTITFSSGANNPVTQSAMRSCASEAYYHAPSSADLQTIFKSIAGQLSELRLVK